MTRSALLVCDANAEHGSGHVMRQITLGSELVRRGVRTLLWCHEVPENLVARAESFGLGVVARPWGQSAVDCDLDWEWCAPDIVAFDGYRFDKSVVEGSRRKGRTVVVVDDNGDHADVECDVILNQNLHATAAMYGGSLHRRLMFLGTEWALIRHEVTRLAAASPTSARSGVFISVGGLDVTGLANRLREAAVARRDWAVMSTGGLGGGSAMSPLEMAERMVASRTGLIAFGTTTWEALCLGLPVVGVVVADNQEGVAQSIEAADLGSVFDFRNHPNVDGAIDALEALYDDPRSILDRTRRGRDLVDGHGAQRVADRLVALVG